MFTSNQTSIPSQQVSSLLYFPMTLPAWGMEVVFLARKECDKSNSESGRSRTGSYGVGFSLSNGILSLKFDQNSHIVGHGAHSLYQAYLRFDESVSITPSVTDGANVYTFDPSAASQKPTILSPKVLQLSQDDIQLPSHLSLCSPSCSPSPPSPPPLPHLPLSVVKAGSIFFTGDKP